MTNTIETTIAKAGLHDWLIGREGGRKSEKYVSTLIARVGSLVKYYHVSVSCFKN
jgi:hypothetical protein